MQLRPYQAEAVAAVNKEWKDGNHRTLLVLPTGCGKTIVFATIVADVARHGGRSLILAHRGELLEQAADKIMKVSGIECAVEKASETSLGADSLITVGSVQTLQRESRLLRFSPSHFSTIVVDEAHHAVSDSYQRILTHFSGAKILGVTATADRGDRKTLASAFDSIAYEYTLDKAVREGYLCPIRAQTIPLKIDMSGVKVNAGDFMAADIGCALEPYLEQIAKEMAHYCQGRKTVAFLPLISTSKKLRDMLEANGLRAAEVNGDSPDRAEILADFDAGKYDVLCNSMLLTEGWDCPSVDTVVVLRPTKVRSLYCQMVGRGTRLSPETGKDHLLLLDFLWHTERHELCRPASLVAKNDETREKMTETLCAATEPMDLFEAEEQAERDAVAEREESLKRHLEEVKNRQKKLVDPLQFEFSIASEDLVGYVPAFAWEMQPMTEKQGQTLEKLGIDPTNVESKGKASLILDKLIKRADAGLSTPKQIRCLERRGFRNVGTWTFSEANAMIGRLSRNHWRMPYGINPAAYNPREAVSEPWRI